MLLEACAQTLLQIIGLSMYKYIGSNVIENVFSDIKKIS